MKQVAVKGDEYEIWADTYSAPETQNPPKPDPPDPEDPDKYSSPPAYDPIYKISKPQDLPDDGSEYVFCQGKPVVIVGYEFSKMTKETYRREWELDEETGHIKGKKEEKKSTDEVHVKAVDGNDFVFAGGIPFSCIEGGVQANGVTMAIIDGKLQPAGATSATGKFTKCKGHVYIDS